MWINEFTVVKYLVVVLVFYRCWRWSQAREDSNWRVFVLASFLLLAIYSIVQIETYRKYELRATTIPAMAVSDTGGLNFSMLFGGPLQATVFVFGLLMFRRWLSPRREFRT